MKRFSTAAVLSLAALALTATTRAQTVAYTRVPLHSVVTQLDQKYGMDIVLKGNLVNERTTPITFSVGDPDTSTTRLQIMNALSNAVGVDFQKGFVVSKLAANQTLPPVQIDTDAFVVFKNKTMSAQDAITIVGNSDNATVQIAPEVTGDVTFSATTLRTSQAAREIAQQTQTVWRSYYALTPDNIMANSPHPFVYFGSPARPTPAATTPATPTTASAPAGGTGVATPAGEGVNVAPVPFQYAPSMNDGYNPYGSPYGGYNPYGSPYGGFDTYGGSPFGGSGVTILPGTGGYGPFGGYGGPPITF